MKIRAPPRFVGAPNPSVSCGEVVGYTLHRDMPYNLRYPGCGSLKNNLPVTCGRLTVALFSSCVRIGLAFKKMGGTGRRSPSRNPKLRRGQEGVSAVRQTQDRSHL
jgi:hypothetical protein